MCTGIKQRSGPSSKGPLTIKEERFWPAKGKILSIRDPVRGMEAGKPLKMKDMQGQQPRAK